MPDRDKMPWLPGSQKEGRVAPRDCVRAAKDDLDKAWGYEVPAIPHLIGAIDWLRRALEQMAEPFDIDAPCPNSCVNGVIETPYRAMGEDFVADVPCPIHHPIFAEEANHDA